MSDTGKIIALIKALGGGGGGGGTSNYNSLSNRPSINGVTLAGDKTGSDLGLADLSTVAPDYSDLTFPVAAGTLCTHNGGLYSANDAIATSEEWTAAHWTEVTLASLLAALVSDVKINGTSVVTNRVANVPVASDSAYGIVKTAGAFGIGINAQGQLFVARAYDNQIKAGTETNKPITPDVQHKSVFYALAKAAGADMKNVTGETVGVYPETQKSAISDMLNAPETVSGTTPTITAKSGVRYICGECATLDITVPASGCIDVMFDSGSTATVLTVTLPTGWVMAWPDDFNPASLKADTTYEINILMKPDSQKCIGVVGSWT